ncbi:VPLPA-CTERM sorting domain-containing protein [Massilia oculi]|uniref:VPLPA-CTERM sorting domain-containing protein n=1 Tax=Massilia hydrophila TaxID=3044279 RepID=A0ABS7YC31_9BURK|nr:DVUA0089 family protein [Massilia oculi]MCA1857243.1 VPLPA-CTERM sorting domain-containing protein [Massilia oculi]
MKLKQLFAIALLGSASLAQAANLSFTGNFTYDNDVQRFNFTLTEAGKVTLRSWSYAGGVNAAGQTILRGGFDPILALFSADGTRIAEQDDAGCSLVDPDAVTGSCWDVNRSADLLAGNYIVTIQQYSNFSLGDLSAGYTYDGVDNRNFRDGFVDENGDRRDSHWAFDILNVASAEIPPDEPGEVPEPASLGLLAAGTAGLAMARRRRKLQA